jgi:hypothetical protein
MEKDGDELDKPAEGAALIVIVLVEVPSLGEVLSFVFCKDGAVKVTGMDFRFLPMFYLA